jgi:hypothetical protein
MQLLLDIHGYSYVPDAAVPEIQAAVARLAELAAKAGFPLKTDCQATQPETSDAVVPEKPA